MIRPNFWSSDKSWEENIKNLDDIWDGANRAVCALRRGEEAAGLAVVDELAILVPSKRAAMSVIEQAVGDHGAYFNNAIDYVNTEPFETSYKVQYHFIKVYGKAYRIEVMHLLDGHSPLHTVLALATARGTGREFPVVHASWKPISGENKIGYTREQRILREGGYKSLQECRSTYGRFGYWQGQFKAEPTSVYLKPRINVRDNGVPA